ncbi:RICIN domain-containing protein [Agilicoccus flavus]|uniref:RICIN domain-containing protein n=1 Tax=Agilicoccus flavus TaxID=2775968 RepID=UPI001CF67B84|nr:RICIN domain-containing protein [Agilicoccus flavus]
MNTITRPRLTRAGTITSVALTALLAGGALGPAAAQAAVPDAAGTAAAAASAASSQTRTSGTAVDMTTAPAGLLRAAAPAPPPPVPRTIQRLRLATVPVQVVNTYSNLAADVMGGSTAVGTGTWLWPRTGSAAQLLDFLPTGDGYYRIRVRHSGQCLMLDWRTGAYKDGTKIVQHPYCNTGYFPSQWRLQNVRTSYTVNGATVAGPSYTRLVNRRTGLCLDADNPRGYTPPVRAALQQWRCLPTTGPFGGNQSWDILRHGQNRAS